ncbi:MAG: hypothetical protein ACJ76X_06260 [Solirubrobacteraceae bacterium]
MSESLAVRAEILKLARLLRREPADLEYLASVPAADIRALREEVTDVLFTAHGQALARLAAGSKVLPVALVATLGERVFGAVLSARIAGLLDPGRAVEMAARMPTPFLADVAVELDPRRASEVICRIPPEQIAAITSELIGRGEYVTMGRFVGHLTPACITAAVEVMDDRSLLHVAFVLESKESLKDLIGVLPPDRLDGIIRAAAEENLWPEVLDLLTHLTLEQRRALVERAAARDDGSTLAALLAAAQQEDMWAELLPLMPLLPAEGRQRVAAIVAAMDPGERDEISRHVRAAGLMDRLGPLGEALLDGRPG